MQENKHKIYKCFLILSVICITISGCNSRKTNVLQIEIPTEVDFGKIITSRNKKNKFDIDIPLKNLSENKIQVAQIQTSCKCLISKISNTPFILEPKESSVIKLNFTPTELDYGYIERVVFIYFYGYESPILVTIKGIVSNDEVNFSIYGTKSKKEGSIP